MWKTREVNMPDHTAAFDQVKHALLEGEGKVINDLSEVAAIGHRIVQGGSKYDRSVLVTEPVIQDIDDYAALAPLHNKAHVQGIRAATAAFGKNVPQVVVFDTAFHQTMPPRRICSVSPMSIMRNTVSAVTVSMEPPTDMSATAATSCWASPAARGQKIITCHLGNGSSIAAIKDGKVIDTTMGLTPLDGFIMGTRSGAVDPSVVLFIMEQENLTPQQMSDILNKKSGMLGISGVSVTTVISKRPPRRAIPAPSWPGRCAPTRSSNMSGDLFPPWEAWTLLCSPPASAKISLWCAPR